MINGRANRDGEKETPIWSKVKALMIKTVGGI